MVPNSSGQTTKSCPGTMVQRLRHSVSAPDAPGTLKRSQCDKSPWNEIWAFPASACMTATSNPGLSRAVIQYRECISGLSIMSEPLNSALCGSSVRDKSAQCKSREQPRRLGDGVRHAVRDWGEQVARRDKVAGLSQKPNSSRPSFCWIVAPALAGTMKRAGQVRQHLTGSIHNAALDERATSWL